MLGEVNAALSLWDRFSKWWKGRKNPPSESIASRFVRLLESHGVHRNQIPRFMGHGLTLKDVQEDGELLEKLNEELLDALCKKFAVRRQWLDGAEQQIHPCYDFYGDPVGFADFLTKLISENPNADLHGRLFFPKDFGVDAEALIILQETIGAVGDQPIYRFHLLNNWLPSYWKSRGQLTACVAVAWEHNICLSGAHLERTELDRLRQGRSLLGWGGAGIWSLGDKKWYPEDMALEPQAFLKGIDPENEQFGIRSALEMWLDLEEKGMMKVGIEKEGVRDKFLAEWKKYS